ncbi:hypothetical protein AB685_13945 [Bacillus sp. LL01]|uniref:ATP-binding protein n=1 Tax=Bacillus sp. LL01 TaxID=1665556 RepID=UPI00064D378F|nr:AAA family ATPase [Bacillus sp. LL01]KMJ57930.1 hypothetical protein AB685_13945 [Bacillus sp. LL01]
MKIKALHIYGFGKLENVMVENFSPAIQVFYGENEAGKSTIMAFIHAVLFGFPAKNQQDLRYLPKKGYKYGGKLIIETNDQRSITIERIAGRSSGDVSVLDEQGNQCELDDILGGLDRSMYKGIFSFNIMDLQNLKLIDAEQLGGYLFSSGLIGSDQLHKLSNQLNKEQEDRFKPNGRKPEINRLLISLKDEAKTVQLWKGKIEEYERLQSAITDLDEQLKAIQQKKEDGTTELKYIEAMLAIQPLVDKIELIQYQMKSLGDVESIPVDGLSRMEKWQTEEGFYQTKLEKVFQDIRDREKELLELQVNQHLLDKKEMLKQLLSQRPTYEQAKNQLVLLSSELEKLDNQIVILKTELDWKGLHDETIDEVNTSLASKADLKELLKQNHELSIQKQRLDELFQATRDELEMQEERVQSLEKELLPVDEVMRMKKVVGDLGKDSLEKEIHVTEQLLSQLERQLEGQEFAKRSKKKNKIITGTVTFLIGLAGSIALFLQNQFFLALLFFLIFGVISFMITRKYEPDGLWADFKKEKEELQSKLEKLRAEFFSSGTYEKLDEYQQALAKEEQVNHLLQKERLLLSQSERAYNKIIHQFEEWEKENFLFEDNWRNWAKSTRLAHISCTFMEEAFDKVVLLKSTIVDRKALIEKKKHYELLVEDFTVRVTQMVKDINWEDEYASPEDVLSQIDNIMEEHINRRQRADRIEEIVSEMREESTTLAVHLEDARKKIHLLYEQACVKDENSFRLKSHQRTEQMELERDLALVSSQLKQLQNAYHVTLEASRPLDSWKKDKEELERKLGVLNENQQHLLEKRTATYETIRHLEEGGTYSDAVQRLELSKSTLQRHARKWAVYATAQHLLTKTMDFYRTVKLPKVLEHASEHFRFLTDENYVRVHDNKLERKIIVEHQDGTIFEPKELSQATIEQLYIAIRFAVAQVWSEEQRLPFMMDDSFVNFDRKRSDLAIELMNRLAQQGNQFIFFTCHHSIQKRLSHGAANYVFSFSNNTAVGTFSSPD